jgi:hypothetical protein
MASPAWFLIRVYTSLFEQNPPTPVPSPPFHWGEGGFEQSSLLRQIYPMYPYQT